jgi:glycosyltransferase involved in cell wall biosynthesis
LKTSIIIITYNGSKKIARLLHSISMLREKDFEVIVVNDGSTDDTEETIRNLQLKFAYRIVSQENRGRAAAKNRGAQESAGELLWFIDDDMRVMPHTLDAHQTHHRTHPGSVCVGTQEEDEAYMTTDIQRYKCHISRSWKLQIESASNPLNAGNLYMTSANVSMPKNVFSRLQGFDERLRDAEDLDLVYRAFQNDVPVYYNNAATGFHLDLITCRSYIIRNRQYMEGYEVLRKMKPDYMKINNRMVKSVPSGFKKMVLSFISVPAFVKMIDHFNVFMILPAMVRYRFYELLIYGLGRIFPERKI